jgi:hypothetical protein
MAALFISYSQGNEEHSSAVEEVEQEFGLITEIRPEVPRFPVATTGAAAKILLGREVDAIDRLSAAPPSSGKAAAPSLRRTRPCPLSPDPNTSPDGWKNCLSHQ